MKAASGLWDMVSRRQHLDAAELARAIETEASRPDLDFRTRVLIRDAVHALQSHWGRPRMSRWLAVCPCRTHIEAVEQEELGEPGFGSLVERIVDVTQPEVVDQFFRELGLALAKPVRIVVGGSIALIVSGHLMRHTEDVDVVDEVPEDIRSLRPLLRQLEPRYGLRVAHFQSHYLPSGWQERVHCYGDFGRLQVSLVDTYDIFVGKLFSRREKDLDDLRHLASQLERSTVSTRVGQQTAWLADPKLRPSAEKNWYIVFGEPLPVRKPEVLPESDGGEVA
jgi:hypothetical protein